MNEGWIPTDGTSTHTDTRGKNFLYYRNKFTANQHIKPLLERKLVHFERLQQWMSKLRDAAFQLKSCLQGTDATPNPLLL